MPKMRIATRAADFGAPHPVRVVVDFLHRVLRDRRVEARPAGAGFEFGVGRKQRRAARYAIERAAAFLLQQRAGEWPLGAMLARDAILLGTELRAPLGIRLLDFGF